MPEKAKKIRIIYYYHISEIIISPTNQEMRFFEDGDDAKAFEDGKSDPIKTDSEHIESQQGRNHHAKIDMNENMNTEGARTENSGHGCAEKIKSIWSTILRFAAWFTMVFKLIYKGADSSSHESEGRFAPGKHCHHTNTLNIGFIGSTIIEPTIQFNDHAGDLGLGLPPPTPATEILSRQLSFQSMAHFGRDHLFPPVADLAPAGFRLVGNNIVCDGCHRAHPVADYPTMDLSPTSLHYASCRYIDHVLCRNCCQGMGSMGQDGQEVCIRCGQTRTMRTFGHNVVIPIAENQQAMKAFVEETCCVEGCNRVVHFQPGLERCITCCGIVCRHCAGRPH